MAGDATVTDDAALRERIERELRTRTARRVFGVYALVTLGLAIWLVVSYLVAENAVPPWIALGASALAFGIGYAAYRVQVSSLAAGPRLVLVLGLGYHALFAPVALWEAREFRTRNDMLTVRAFPHFIEWINSFE